jgi:site-specific DNA-methyltransferase (adenine-specific)
MLFPVIAEDLKPLSFAIEKLRLLPGNPRRGNVEAVRRSLEAFGQRKPIVVRRSDRVVIAGNHTLLAAQALGWAEIAVVWVDDDDTTSKAFALADNRTAELGDYDEAALAELIGQVGSVDPDLLLASGWDKGGVSELLNELDVATAKIQDDILEIEVPVRPITKDGDLWMLGKHRVLCGDSFSDENRAQLLNGATVKMVATDPPYAVFGSSTGVGLDVADDKMVRPFFENLFRIVAGHLSTFDHAYFFTDWRSWSALWEGARRGGLAIKNMLVWDKGNFGMGTSYSNCYELIGFYSKPPREKTMSSREAGVRTVMRSNILRFPRVTGDDRHINAAKPIALMEELIGNSSKPDDVVLDLFGGSGSTLFACQNLGRRAFMIEIEPKFVDVICRRFQRTTGIKPVRSSDNHPVDFLNG